MKIFFKMGILLSLIFQPAAFSFADDVILGHSCYTYGDKESLLEAREITRALAIRNAIESYRVFIMSATAVKNFQLRNDLIQMISVGYLKDLKIIEHKEEGRTICEKIQCAVSPQEIEKAIKEHARQRLEETEELGLDNNGYLKILKVGISRKVSGNKGEEEYPTYFVTLKVLKRPINPSADIYFKICMDQYNEAGEPVLTNCWSVIPELIKIFARGRMNVVPGQIITSIGPKAPQGQGGIYRVWLPKPKAE